MPKETLTPTLHTFYLSLSLPPSQAANTPSSPCLLKSQCSKLCMPNEASQILAWGSEERKRMLVDPGVRLKMGETRVRMDVH